MHVLLEKALKDVGDASRCLSWWYCRPDKALSILTLLHQLEMPEGAERKQYDLMIGVIMAVTANCYVVKKEPVKAAEFYRKAEQYRKGGRYSSVYARIALKHNLKDHYQAALESIEIGIANHRKLPVFFKLFTCFFYRWWMHPRLWRVPLMERLYARRLRNRIMEK